MGSIFISPSLLPSSYLMHTHLSGDSVTISACFMHKEQQISLIASFVAVAVRAITLASGKIALNCETFTKAGLKSDFPHERIQWASSTIIWLTCKFFCNYYCPYSTSMNRIDKLQFLPLCTDWTQCYSFTCLTKLV